MLNEIITQQPLVMGLMAKLHKLPLLFAYCINIHFQYMLTKKKKRMKKEMPILPPVNRHTEEKNKMVENCIVFIMTILTQTLTIEK